jgi:hypothetical protein
MNKQPIAFNMKGCIRQMIGVTAALTLLGVSVSSFADPVTLSPPGIGQGADGATIAADQDNVFQWTEVPQNQKVPITRAVFDQSGYQLYDSVGETVVVPFTNDNLYVMKFAPSDDGTMYLLNDGDAPVLYVPKGGYLENATEPGARWYPFSKGFHPTHPVFIGVAPSWHAFISLGWAPDVVVRGGYWGRTSFVAGGVFAPSAGLVFEVGGQSYSGWTPYHAYVVAHPDHFRFGAEVSVAHPHMFRGAGGGTGYAHDGARGGDQGYRATDHGTGGHHVFQGARGASRRDRP